MGLYFIGKNCNSTEIGTDKSGNLIFGFLTESKAEPFAHASGWGTPKAALQLESTDDLSTWSLVAQKDIRLFGQSMNFCKNGQVDVRSDLDLKLAVTVSAIE